MTSEHEAVDVEALKDSDNVFEQKPLSEGDRTSSAFFIEAAALLTIWSLLVINEGAIRLIDTNPSAGLEGGRPPQLLVFLASLAEVVFGLVGLFVGVAGFIFRWYSTTWTKVSLLLQTILGYFVFAVFVFVRPAVRAIDLTEPTGELTLGQEKFLIALGVLTSFHFCLALQGGQFVFFARLICAGSGQNFLMQNTGNRMRAVFWNANLGLAGLWTLITGALISANVGGGKLDMPFESPPNVGRLPALTIATGILLIVFAAKGIVLALSNKPAPWSYFLLSGIVYLFAYLNWTIVQFGLIGKPNEVGPSAFGGPVAMHGGLVYMVVFLGPYFVHLASKERKA